MVYPDERTDTRFLNSRNEDPVAQRTACQRWVNHGGGLYHRKSATFEREKQDRAALGYVVCASRCQSWIDSACDSLRLTPDVSAYRARHSESLGPSGPNDIRFEQRR